jgi:hypothetical protein
LSASASSHRSLSSAFFITNIAEFDFSVPSSKLSFSLSELINERGRSLIQIIERMPLTMIINPSHQYFSVFSSRLVTLRLNTVLIEGSYKP